MANFKGENNKISTALALPLKCLPASYEIVHEVEKLSAFVSPCKIGYNNCFWLAKLFETFHTQCF